MSITDELREYTKHYSVAGSKKDTMLSSIADRIDEAIAGEYVRLPKDADGVTIHIGDYLHCDETGKDFPCRGYCCSVGKNGERRWTVECSYDAYSGTSEYVSARRCRHHHEPTVEDVLQDFAHAMYENLGMYTGVAIDADEWLKAYANTITEYAEKLREVVE